MAKAKKSKAKKSKAKKSNVKRAKTAQSKSTARAAKAKAKSRKSKKPVKKAPAKKAAARKPAPKKKKQIVGEGDYAASRAFLKDQSGFVARNQGKIPAMGKAAEAAMEGPEGGELRAAEEEARSHAKE